MAHGAGGTLVGPHLKVRGKESPKDECVRTVLSFRLAHQQNRDAATGQHFGGHGAHDQVAQSIVTV